MHLKSVWKHTFPAFVLCLFLDFVGGVFLGISFEVLMENYPIILIALPGLMGIRGNIFGSLASRFSTSLYLGEMPPQVFSRKVYEGVSLSLFLSLIPVAILWFVGILKTPVAQYLTLVVLIVSTTFACLVLSFSTALATIIPFRRGIDPDYIAPPLITSIADLLTIPTLIIFIFIAEKNMTSLILITAIMFSIIFYFLVKFRIKIRVLLEIGTVLSFLALLSSVSGITLQSFSEIIYEIFILSVMYPALLDSFGNYGSAIGSKVSTKLHLGEVEKLFSRKVFDEILSLLTTAFVIPVIMYLTASAIVYTMGKPFYINFIFFLLYPIFAFVSMVIAATVAVYSFRKGLDPDNVTVPTITTLADVIATFFAVLIAFLSV
ncbi:MAG: magnesium transporter [Archaeoglobaceae archaeon]|nr:magnesium transporter [Archaeoglobaceae archaeon]MCX8151494.1 magnesium transporter [Archaeoglobaceae archaeon]MDW8014030.1 magnesium transporter [Archaeoglobaceae archaeon]